MGELQMGFRRLGMNLGLGYETMKRMEMRLSAHLAKSRRGPPFRAVYIRAARQEEKALSSAPFAKAYDAYRAKTSFMIPKLG